MCFSAAANFAGSGVLATVGVLTLTKVKHRRELLFASLPTLFAIHQFIEGFVWLGLDGVLSPRITHNMGAAFMLYAQGLLPFLLPLSVLLFEPNTKSRRRMLPFLVVGSLPPFTYSGPSQHIQPRFLWKATVSCTSIGPRTTRSLRFFTW
jgi:hypothetical protein